MGVRPAVTKLNLFSFRRAFSSLSSPPLPPPPPPQSNCSSHSVRGSCPIHYPEKIPKRREKGPHCYFQILFFPLFSPLLPIVFFFSLSPTKDIRQKGIAGRGREEKKKFATKDAFVTVFFPSFFTSLHFHEEWSDFHSDLVSQIRSSLRSSFFFFYNPPPPFPSMLLVY